MFGVDMMLKSLGLEPETIKNTVEGIGKRLVDLQKQLDRIEANQMEILLAAQGAKVAADASASHNAAATPDAALIAIPSGGKAKSNGKSQ